jgi:hypothetical protein
VTDVSVNGILADVTVEETVTENTTEEPAADDTVEQPVTDGTVEEIIFYSSAEETDLILVCSTQCKYAPCESCQRNIHDSCGYENLRN